MFGLPELEESRQHNQGHDGRGDVGQFRANVVGREELTQRETAATDQHGRPGLLDAAPAVHDGHQPEQHDNGHERQLTASHLADEHGVQTRDLPGHNDRNAHGTKGDRCGIADQAQTGGIQRLEAQAHQQGSSDGDGGTKACSAFQKCTKTKAHQNQLQALVFGDRQNRRANDVELPGLDRNLVEKHGRHNDPGDGPQTIEEAVNACCQRVGHRHFVEEQCNGQSQCHGDGARNIAFEAQTCQRQKEKDDGNERNQR